MKSSVITGLVMGCVLFWSLGAIAQPGARGPRMSPEQLESIWTAQAKSVAGEAGLSEEATAKVVEAYKASRHSLGETLEELRASGERGPGSFQAYREAMETEQAKLKADLKDVVPEDQADKVLTPLCTFSRQWDRMTQVLSELKLEGENASKAQGYVVDYVVESDKAREKAMASGDFQAIREAMQEAKQSLDAKLADVLSEEQLSEWNDGTAWRGRGGGGRRGPGGEDDDA